MFNDSEESYFRVGRGALALIVGHARMSGRGAFGRILDFPSGHGRVLRYLGAAFPDAELVACDLEPDAVQFCRDTFGATGIISRERSEEIELRGRFGLIWCGSLLTHIEIDRWRDFLQLFADHLADNGLLIFTTAGRHVAEQAMRVETHNWKDSEATLSELDSFEEQGFAYRTYPATFLEGWSKQRYELDELDCGYGACYAKPSRVMQEIEKVAELAIVACRERGWDSRQDVYACALR